jgi:pilus assembly protein CpaB
MTAMKMKFLILLVVFCCGLTAGALGSGVLTALLTSQNGAAPKKVDDSIEVPVAAKDLPVGTKLIKDELKNYVTYKKVRKETLPAELVASEEQLADKRLVRTVRAGETINPWDLTTSAPINPPPGFSVMSFRVAPENVSGSLMQGSRVDVLATFKHRKHEKPIVVPVLTDVLVLAVDTYTEDSQQGGSSKQTCFAPAVNNKQFVILHATLSRGADISLVVRNPDKPTTYNWVPTEEEIWDLLSDESRPELAPEPRVKEVK